MQAPTSAPFTVNRAMLYLPIRYSIAYLLLTYLLFIFSGLSSQVGNTEMLTAFVLSAYLSLLIGYVFGIKTAANRASLIADPPANRLRRVNVIIIIGALYLAIWGINQISDFGGQSISQVLDAAMNPGAAYSAKFEVYEKRTSELRVNPITQILVLCGVIFSISIPALAAYWKYVDFKTKGFAFAGVFIYIVSFLYIGTQKGLGDVVLLSLAGWSVARVRRGKRQGAQQRAKSWLIVGLLATGAFIYMALNQASRAVEFGITTTMMAEGVSDTLIAKLFGDNFAVGFYTLLGYPSHGYLGLSHNLERDFVFSYGAGLSPAFESYRLQYFGGADNLLMTYPHRTEAATGWPAGMYWSTAFPWFASDLSFLGVLPLMFLVGMLYARTWMKCLRRMDVISLAVLGQLFLFVAFLPANNQVLISRQGLLSAVVLALIVLIRRPSARDYAS